jgi:hypothetical protein
VKGDLGETAVMNDLVEEGYEVSLPFGSYSYDLVACIDGDFYTIQVKEAGLKPDYDNAVKANIHKSGRDYDQSKRKYDEDSFDILAVYCRPWGEVAYRAWDEPVWTYTVRQDDGNLPDRGGHLINLIEDQTLESAIERFK